MHYFKLVINTGRLKIISKILFIEKQLVGAQTAVPQYPSVSFSRRFFLPAPKEEASYKDFLTVAMGFFLSFENSEAGKKISVNSGCGSQVWSTKTPPFPNSSHRLSKCLMLGLAKEHNITDIVGVGTSSVPASVLQLCQS